MTPNGVAEPQGQFRRFVKLILQPNYLLLPPMFVRTYGDELGGIAQLTVSNGRVWKVKVKREEGGEVWFWDGFSEFANHYSISYGYFLIFNYNNHSKFIVNIFDNTGYEIAYPPHQEEDEEEDDDHDLDEHDEEDDDNDNGGDDKEEEDDVDE